jgi:prophage endopeptidase
MSAITRYLILVLVAILSAWLYGWYQYRQGYADRETFAKLQTAIQNEVARANEQEQVKKNSELDKKHYEELRDAQKTIDRLRADFAAGRRRLSVRVKRPVCPAHDTKTAGLDYGATRAELDGQVAQDLIGIVAEGDQAIRQLNALQDYVRLIHQEGKK